MKIQYLTLACVLGMLMGPTLNAEPERGGGPAPGGDRKGHMKERMERMAEYLELTDAQKEQLKAHHEAQAPKRKAIMEDESMDREQKKAEMMKLKEEHDAFLETVLTPEQLAKHKQMRDKIKDRIGERKGKGPGAGPGAGAEAGEE